VTALAALVVAATAALFTVFGLGGGIVYLPLIYGLGASYRVAASTALLLNVVAGSAATLEYVRGRRMIGAVVWPAALIGVAVAPLAAFEAGRSDVRLLRWGLVALLAFAALRFLTQGESESRPESARRRRPPRSILLLTGVALGAGNGVVAGLLGIGGGIITSPLLLAAGVSPARTAATTAPIVVAASAAGFIGHLSYGVVDTRWALACVPAALIGGAIGSRIHRIGGLRPELVKRAFGALLAAAAVLVGSITAGRADPYNVDRLSHTVLGILRLAEGEGPGLSPRAAERVRPVLEALVRLRRGGTLSPEAQAASAGVLDGFADALRDALPEEQRRWLGSTRTSVRDLRELSRAPFDLAPGSPTPRVRDVPPLDLRRMRWWRTGNAVRRVAEGGGGSAMALSNRPPWAAELAEQLPLPIRLDRTSGALRLRSDLVPADAGGSAVVTLWVDGDGDRRLGADADVAFRWRRSADGGAPVGEAGRYVGRVDDPDLLADDQSLWRWSPAAEPLRVDPERARLLVRLSRGSPDAPQIGRPSWQWPRATSTVLDPATWEPVSRLPSPD